MDIRSVVMMASDASVQFLAVPPNFAIRFGVAFIIFSEGRGIPIIPVEAMKTSFCKMPSSSATFLVIVSQSFNPFGPVTVFALPLLTITARQLPDFASALRLQMTAGETTRFLVNTAAAVAGTSDTMRARSFIFLSFIPQCSPVALKPGTEGLRFFNIFMICYGKIPGD